MNKIIMTRGLPGSGKSTWAKEYLISHPHTIRINKDCIREMLHFSVWSGKNEKIVERVFNETMANGLYNGYDLILDNTHLDSKYPKVYKDYLTREGYLAEYEWEIKDFTFVSVEECMRRDAERSNKVGRQVILRLYEQGVKHGFYTSQPTKYEKITTEWEERQYDSNLSDCIIVDLDGNLSLFSGNAYARDFINDRLNNKVSGVINRIVEHENPTIIIFSGRSDAFKNETLMWLEKNDVHYDKIFMRSDLDKRSDDILKEEFYHNHIENKYNVLFILDDRLKVCRMWSRLGLFTFCTNQGIREF